MPSMPRLISLTVLTTLIVFLGMTFFRVIAPFLLPLFLAGVVTILCRPVFQYFLSRLGGRIRLAAAATTTAVLLTVLLPFLVGVTFGALQLYVVAQRAIDSGWIEQNMGSLREALDRDTLFEHVRPFLPTNPSITDSEQQRAYQKMYFEARLNQFYTDAGKQLKSLAQQLVGVASKTLGRTFSIFGAMVSQFVSMLMFLIALYYFLSDGPALLKGAESMIPVHVDYQRELLIQFDKAVRAVVLATFFAAVGQGFATAVALYVVGKMVASDVMCHFLLFFIVSTFSALIPVAGTWLVWAPFAGWLAYTGHWGAAIGLTACGVVIVGMLDNVIRTYMLQSDTKLHPLLAFISVLGGLQVLGLWGVFIGPIIACCLHALVKIFNVELKELAKSRFQDEDNDEDGTERHRVEDVAPASRTHDATPENSGNGSDLSIPKSSREHPQKQKGASACSESNTDPDSPESPLRRGRAESGTEPKTETEPKTPTQPPNDSAQPE